MIIDGKLLTRIKEIREKYDEGYKYILLGFFKKNKVEIFFSNQDKKTISRFSNMAPLLLIYDRDKYEENKSGYIDHSIYKVLGRSIEDEKIQLVKSILKNISYDYFIAHKEEIIRMIGSAMQTIKIVDIFEKTLNSEYLTPKNIKDIQSLEKVISGIEVSIENTDKSDLEQLGKLALLLSEKESDLIYKKAQMQSKNINAIIRSNKCVFLHNYFFKDFIEDKKTLYKEFDKSSSKKMDLFKEFNEYNSKDIKKIVDIFLQQKRTYSDTYYKQILNEIEYCNLYTYDYPLVEDRYRELHSKLFSSHKLNKLTALKTSFLEYDIFLSIGAIIEFDFLDSLYQWFFDKYKIEFQASDYEMLLSNKEVDNVDVGLMNKMFNFGSSSEEIEDLFELKKNELIEFKISKFNEEFLYEYIENLQVGKTKHRKT